MSKARSPNRFFRRVAGCDLGKASAKFVVGHVDEGGELSIESTSVVDHDCAPLRAFSDWYRREKIHGCSALGATGLYAAELAPPVRNELPEDACLESALRWRKDLTGALHLVRIGARGYSVLTRDRRGRFSYLENEKCSSGTGETMVKIAGRFGLGIEEADRLAASVTQTIPITARCSVFAKSEMTHFGNQGKPAAELFRGYFESVARYVLALLSRARRADATLLIGGGSRLRSLVDLFGELVDGPVSVPDQALLLEALGAACIAGAPPPGHAPAPLPQDPDALLQPTERSFTVLAPASAHAHRVTRLPAPPPTTVSEPCILGLDLGSTGSKAVLTSLGTGEPLLDLYDRTMGNPVDATHRLIQRVLTQAAPDVRAIGVTGSGREAAATVLRAVFASQAERIVVVNEIVAHATAAIRCDDRDGESLSVVEIGGQDAKFIQIAGGQIVASDMNKACSAGTGSFLAEQAVFYGVDDIEEFNRLAKNAERPPDLGQMCTVFVAEAADQALKAGFTIPDIFAGFQYAVIHNYIRRVMGQRTFAERIFFQGKPATSPTLAWTLAAVTGRDVVVPPNPGAMGAWGISLCVLRDLDPAALGERLPLEAALQAEVVERSEFRCRDANCSTHCVIEKTTVAVADQRKNVLSGGACPKYEISGASRLKLPKETPSPFDQRRELLEPLLVDHPGELMVGVVMAGALCAVMPWVTTFLRELGLGVRVLRSDSQSLCRGEDHCFAYDTCAPVKIAHGVAHATDDVDMIFLPKILDLADRDGPGGRTCPMEQGLPEMVEQSLKFRNPQAQVRRPVLRFQDGFSNAKLVAELEGFAAQTGRGKFLALRVARVYRAVRAAAQAQMRYEASLAAIGSRAIAHSRAHGIPLVVVCGSLHVIHDPVASANIPTILRKEGVIALPMDCLSLPAGIHQMPRIPWAEANRVLRASLHAREQGDLYPVFLSSFGCGPASFVETVFADLMRGYPHTTLESDGHGGAAGYVTRCQAFLHTVRQHDGAPSALPLHRTTPLAPLPSPSILEERSSKLVIFTLSDQLGPLAAAYYRSLGFDADCAPPASAKTLEAGRRDCTGKECLPYQLIWGSFREYLDEHPPEKRTVLIEVQGSGMCRNCMFSVKDQITLGRMDAALQSARRGHEIVVRHLRPDPEFRLTFLTRFWSSIVAWDIFHQLAAYYRPLERTKAEVDELYRRFCDALVAELEQPAVSLVQRAWAQIRWWRRLTELIDEASAAFLQIAQQSPPGRAPRVLVTGDIYLRLDEFASDHLTRRLNARGLHVILDPMSVLVEYMSAERSSELLGLPTNLLEGSAHRVILPEIRRRLYSRVTGAHRFLLEPDVSSVRHHASRLLNRYPIGEAPLTIGSVLHSWHEQACDGAVVIGPWGCGPTLIAESLLRHVDEIPLLFIYNDGSPVDERKLDSFVYGMFQRGTKNG